MKKCTNCGADFDSELLKCPYCGYENIEAAQEAYREKIEDLVEEREEIQELPEKVTAKRTKIVFLAVVVFFVLVIALLVIVEVYKKKETKNQIELEQHNKVIMEEYLENGDYEGFYAFYETLEYAYIAYDKYDEIAEVYSWYLWLEDSIRNQFHYITEGTDTERIRVISSAINEYCQVINSAEEYLNDDYLYGSEEHIQEIADMATRNFKEKYLVDDVMIQEILAVKGDYYEDVSLYDEYAEKIAEKLLSQ